MFTDLLLQQRQPLFNNCSSASLALVVIPDNKGLLVTS